MRKEGDLRTELVWDPAGAAAAGARLQPSPRGGAPHPPVPGSPLLVGLGRKEHLGVEVARDFPLLVRLEAGAASCSVPGTLLCFCWVGASTPFMSHESQACHLLEKHMCLGDPSRRKFGHRPAKSDCGGSPALALAAVPPSLLDVERWGPRACGSLLLPLKPYTHVPRSSPAPSLLYCSWCHCC